MNSFSFNPSSGLRDASVYPSEPTSEAAAREQFQGLLDQILNHLNNNVKPEVEGKVNNTDVVTTPAASKLLKLNANALFPIGSIAYQNKQNASGTNMVAGVSLANLPQFSIVSVIATTSDNVNKILANFLVKNYAGITIELFGTKIKSGVITDVILSNDATFLYANVTASSSVSVRIVMTLYGIGSGDI